MEVVSEEGPRCRRLNAGVGRSGLENRGLPAGSGRNTFHRIDDLRDPLKLWRRNKDDRIGKEMRTCRVDRRQECAVARISFQFGAQALMVERHALAATVKPLGDLMAIAFVDCPRQRVTFGMGACRHGVTMDRDT
ncbi:hypothetical protein AZKH_1829 [Azoarcus sp. KH32C]|nr:hypothetical protein AZKH_1829 [Azoarcus sp. KH32C]